MASIANKFKKGGALNDKQAIQSSYMSSDLSTSNAAAALFAKQVSEFMKAEDVSEEGSDESSARASRVKKASALLAEEEDSDETPSKSVGSIGKPKTEENVEDNIENINAMYERYKQFKKLAAKYGNAEGGSGD